MAHRKMTVYKVEPHVRIGGLILIGNDYNNGIVWEVDFMGEGTVLNCFVSFLLLFYGLHLDKGLGYSTTYVFVS